MQAHAKREHKGMEFGLLSSWDELQETKSLLRLLRHLPRQLRSPGIPAGLVCRSGAECCARSRKHE